MARLSKKRGRPSRYIKSLKDNPYWEKVKRKVRIRDNFSCVICGAKINLETHHITYKIAGASIIGKELDYLEWLVTLCAKDHIKAHKNKGHKYNPKNPKKENAISRQNNGGNR